MKLLTHNILTSKVLKRVVNGYPLKLVAKTVEVKQNDFQPQFVKRMMQRVNYGVLYDAANTLGHANGMPKPEEFKEELLEDESILHKIHSALLEIDVIEGELICPETGRSFPIQNGIPNMLANEDEV